MAAASPAPPRAGLPGKLLVVALVLVLAYQLAHWTWVFVAPMRVAAPESAAPAVDLAAVARLFGAEAPAAAGASTGLKLKGVIAPTPGTAASAIFSRGSGRDVAIYIDGEIEPGLKLVEVHPDHVVLGRAGARSRVDLEVARSTNVAARSGLPGKASGFKLNVARTGTNNYTLSRKELDEALRDPGQLSYLGQIGVPPKGGVRMEQAPAGSLAQKLGLQPGDVIKKVNGQTVASAGDLARLYTQFNTLSLVQAEIQRGQSTLQLSYQIQP
jgi:general secretion pathway protein C